jgi:hypothetical protein
MSCRRCSPNAPFARLEMHCGTAVRRSATGTRIPAVAAQPFASPERSDLGCRGRRAQWVTVESSITNEWPSNANGRPKLSLTVRKRNISKSLRASGANWPNALNAQENSPPTSRAVDPSNRNSPTTVGKKSGAARSRGAAPEFNPAKHGGLGGMGLAGYFSNAGRRAPVPLSIRPEPTQTSRIMVPSPISSWLLCELRMRTKKIEPATGRRRLPPKRPPAASVTRRRKTRVVACNLSRPSATRLLSLEMLAAERP